MPISATGKAEVGFTLLEVLAVLTLIGLVAVLAYPQFNNSEEKTKIQLIGELIQCDLQLLKETSFRDGIPQELSWKLNGYRFQIGEQMIIRNFNGWSIHQENTEVGNGQPEAANLADGSEPDAKDNSSKLQFDTSGHCSPQRLWWETPHFRGIIDIKENGSMGWSYEKR